jgi:hypothetical protein
VEGDDQALAAFVAELRRSFGRATETAPVSDRWMRLARVPVRLRIAGEELEQRLLPALAHLTADATEDVPRLAITCWDREETGTALPAPPAPLAPLLAAGRTGELSRSRVRVAYDSWMRMLCVYEREIAEAFVVVAAARDVPAWVERAPLRAIFAWWAADTDMAFLHASSVAGADAAVALVGPSGVGKSTTAMACLADGLGFIGDDACIVRLDGDPTVFSVYAKAKLEPDVLGRLPGFAGSTDDDDRLVVDISAGVVAAAPLRAVLLPVFGNGPTSRVVAMPPTEVRRLLVRTSLLESGVGGTALGPLTELSQRVPGYRLELGSDLGGVVNTVRSLVGSP